MKFIRYTLHDVVKAAETYESLVAWLPPSRNNLINVCEVKCVYLYLLSRTTAASAWTQPYAEKLDVVGSCDSGFFQWNKMLTFYW